MQDNNSPGFKTLTRKGGKMETENQQKRNIIFHIRRFDPELDEVPRWQKFTVSVEPGMTVLDGLHHIKETQDASLSWRYSCRMGVCGSCAMLINGIPTLACNTQIMDVTSQKLTLAALPNFDIIRDLVPDLTPMFRDHVSIQPYIQRDDNKEMENPTREFFQTHDELEEYLQFTYCIKCGCCAAACPTMAADRKYMGPMPLAQAYRYNKDSRDGGQKDRNDVITASHGVFSCHYAGECSNVCPKGVDPARAIQHMKKDLVLGYLRLRKDKKPCQVVGIPTGESKPAIAAPEHTVK